MIAGASWAAIANAQFDGRSQGANASDEVYEQGLDARDAGNLPVAHSLFAGAASLGHQAAQYELAQTYLRGRGTDLNYALARQWYETSASQGFAPAYGALGYLHEQGLGVPKDDARARGLFEEGANLGSPYAQVKLGLMLSQGRGGGADVEAAVRWYQSAADQNEVTAQFNLGVAYEDGTGVPQGDDLAVYWFGRAADQGFALAQYRLGLLLEAGRGAPRDLARAQELFGEATTWLADGSDKEAAAAALARVTTSMAGGGSPQANEIATILAELNTIGDKEVYLDEIQITVGGPMTLTPDGVLMTRVLWCETYFDDPAEVCVTEDGWVLEVGAIHLSEIDLEETKIFQGEPEEGEDGSSLPASLSIAGPRDVGSAAGGSITCFDEAACEQAKALVTRLIAAVAGSLDGDLHDPVVVPFHEADPNWAATVARFANEILALVDIDQVDWDFAVLQQVQLNAEIKARTIDAVVSVEEDEGRSLRSLNLQDNRLAAVFGTCDGFAHSCGEAERVERSVGLGIINAASIFPASIPGPALGGVLPGLVVFSCVDGKRCALDFHDADQGGFLPCRGQYGCESMADHLRTLVELTQTGRETPAPVVQGEPIVLSEQVVAIDVMAAALLDAEAADSFGDLGTPGFRQSAPSPRRLADNPSREIHVTLNGWPGARLTVIYYILADADAAGSTVELVSAPDEASTGDGGFTVRTFDLLSPPGPGAAVCGSRPLELTGEATQVRCAYHQAGTQFHVVVDRTGVVVNTEDSLFAVMDDLIVGLAPALNHLAAVQAAVLANPAVNQPDEVAVDRGFVGVWEFFLPEPQGVARLQLDFRADLTYAFTSSSPTFGPHSGSFEALDGRWQLSSPTWSDGGTYQVLNDDNTLVLEGKFPAAAWTRVR